MRTKIEREGKWPQPHSVLFLNMPFRTEGAKIYVSNIVGSGMGSTQPHVDN
jgi:hypothetical protein